MRKWIYGFLVIASVQAADPLYTSFPQLIHKFALCGSAISTFLQSTNLAIPYAQTVLPLYAAASRASYMGNIFDYASVGVAAFVKPYITLGKGLPLFTALVLALPLTYGVTTMQGVSAGQTALLDIREYKNKAKSLLLSSAMIRTVGASILLAGIGQMFSSFPLA